MSVDISGVNVGDRVRLTRENGDESTFRVGETGPVHLVDTRGTRYYRSEWDALEILPIPLPTNELAMIGSPTDGTRLAYILSRGEWVLPGFDGPVTEEEVRHSMENDGFVVLYEGVPDE